ncbi:hypothetical protein FACS189483_10750 [Spirochaetia bacterium]|nr:hypothetical protein FACS189483_10750 [Spirochaetia bacterium]
MRKLVFILIALIAVVTFIRAFDNTGATLPQDLSGDVISLNQD